MAKRRKRKGNRRQRSRSISLRLGIVSTIVLLIWALVGDWFVHHPRKWMIEQERNLPTAVTTPLLWMGNRVGDLTDSLGWTGHDTVYEYDTSAPSGSVLFAGAPRRVGPPAPDDIRIIDRGEFIIGWSDKLRHPAWCAYHVTKDAKFGSNHRPGFTKDKTIPMAPSPNDYTKSGYDRGHMVPNFAIATRYGEEEQRKTFMMSNIAPQKPALNRGVWRNIEHRIADLWTARYGEIWVVVGCTPGHGSKLGQTDVDAPSSFYQVIMAQEGMDVRALALLFSANTPWNTWAARNIVTIDELEEITGLDFNPELPSFIADPLEADMPGRLWPIRVRDVFKLISLNLN